MPPKAKFTRGQIIEAALSIVKTQGLSALTARSLGQTLGSSARPIFTLFQNMEEVQQAVIREVKNRYASYIAKGLSQEHPFKGVGTQYILFALQEPKLFQLLFMTEQDNIPSLSHILPQIDESYDQIRSSIEKEYHIAKESAERLYQHLWIYTHGIASLCATKMCRFTPEEVNQLMSEVFISLLCTFRKEEKND